MKKSIEMTQQEIEALKKEIMDKVLQGDWRYDSQLQATVSQTIDELSRRGLIQEPLRVLAYDGINFIDDITTPARSLMKPGTVLRFRFDSHGRCVADVAYDHGRISNGHFADLIEPIAQEQKT